MKLKYLSILALMLAAVYFVPSAVSQEKPAGDVNCDEITANLNELKSEYDAAFKEQKKAYEHWNKYYKELHSYSYLDTDRPLIDSYKECEGGEGAGKDFCKGVFKKFDEITAKEEPANVAFDAAEHKANEARSKYNSAVQTASDQGCNPKK